MSFIEEWTVEIQIESNHFTVEMDNSTTQSFPISIQKENCFFTNSMKTCERQRFHTSVKKMETILFCVTRRDLDASGLVNHISHTLCMIFIVLDKDFVLNT